ncbi:nuclear pore complex component-domain-containing protein [Apiospora phragmitis]|uniref:Nuclear pore complex component-domain-containing protein n=1 Tax=Apiospora phragmitis TaxID=2905665 RepID=A0ABR1SW50_9PEZI
MSSAALQRPLTPTKASPAPPQDSPGTWRHPRLEEISKRQNAATFGEKNVKKVVYNVAALIAMFAIQGFVSQWLSPVPPTISKSATYVYRIAQLIPLYNIAVACMPLIQSQDEMSDIALTPGQRKLLGLPPSSNPPSPGSVYSTPPRYSRTPSMSGSTGGKRNFSDSTVNGQTSPSLFRSPLDFGGSVSTSSFGASASAFGGSGSALAGSPLIQKAFQGARRSSFGSPSPMVGSINGGSMFGSGPESPSPSPANGKRSSVSLNNKWLYEKGRRSSGNMFLQAS